MSFIISGALGVDDEKFVKLFQILKPKVSEFAWLNLATIPKQLLLSVALTMILKVLFLLVEL